MTNTYLLDVIKAIQPNKRQELGYFLASKQFNRSKNAQEIGKLYQIILDAAPDFSEKLLNKERVSAQVYGVSIVESGKLEKLIADLNKLLRIFILSQQYLSESNEEAQQLDWAKWLRINGLSVHAQKTLTKLKGKKTKETQMSLERNRNDLLLMEEYHEWESIQNQFKSDLGIPELIYSLDLYYFSYRTELVNRYLLQQKGAQLQDLETEELGLGFYQNKSILLQISKKIQGVLKKDFPAIEEFQEMIKILQTNENALSFQTLAQFYTYLRNLCILLINTGHLEFLPILHELNKDNLQRGYFFVNNTISPNVYLNLVIVANRAKDTPWAKIFTAQYKDRVIGEDGSKFFYKLSMAQILFAEQSFDEALDHIPDVPSNSHYHHLIRRLELKIYYELHSDLLLYKIDAFRKFIVRTATKTIAANLRSMDLNFLNILTQLTQAPPKDKTRSARLLTRIDGKKLLAERFWLIEKAKALG